MMRIELNTEAVVALLYCLEAGEVSAANMNPEGEVLEKMKVNIRLIRKQATRILVEEEFPALGKL